MKAIIMAGGKGTRLRPICDNMPKPMTKLLGRPLMEHSIELLHRHGFNELCVTLGHMPEKIIDHFGSGSLFGVSMEYNIENEPLGTAGGVRSCADFIDGEDFLVISGDAACDFDLSAFAREHFLSGADLSIALYPHPEPLDYGTVVIDNSGNVVNFIEKPPWQRVVTDLVNTGIYIVSPKILDLIPINRPFDFAQDLFPLLMQRGFKLHGSVQKGYWCDIGSPKSYHQCCMDALDGKLKLKPSSSLEIPFGTLAIDSILCRDISIAKNCEFQRSIVHSGSFVGRNTKISDSIIDNASIGKDCTIEGAIICQGTVIPDGTYVCPGAVVSSQSQTKTQKSAPVSLQRRQCCGLVRELSCKNRARLMREMSTALLEAGADFSDGISLNEGKCKVRIAPMAEDSALTIEASGGREKERLEACQKYASLAESFEIYSDF